MLTHSCGQPLPEIMSCKEWKKAGEDFIRQFRQQGGLIKLNPIKFVNDHE